jgi:hypothetical protein
MKSVEELRASVTKHGSLNAAARALGMVRSTLQRQLAGGVPKPMTTAPVKGRSLADFRGQYDIRQKIVNGIKLHLKGVYMTDQEFREVCGVPTGEWRRYADLQEFAESNHRIKGVLYWAQPAMLAQMKEIAGVV